MLHTVRLFFATIGISVQRELAFRTDFLLRVLLTLVTAAGTLVTLAGVYARVEQLDGWRYGDAVVALGMFVIVNGLMQALVEPNLAEFQAKVRTGALDDLLLRPANDAFLASAGTCRPFALIDLPLGAAIVLHGLSRTDAHLTIAAAVASLCLTLIGFAIAWAIRLTLATMAFWAGGLEFSVLFAAPWQLGRYPADLYGSGLRFVVTYIVPVAFVSTAPARALLGGPIASTLVTAGAVATASAVVALRLWRRGLRSYTSATS